MACSWANLVLFLPFYTSHKADVFRKLFRSPFMAYLTVIFDWRWLNNKMIYCPSIFSSVIYRTKHSLTALVLIFISGGVLKNPSKLYTRKTALSVPTKNSFIFMLHHNTQVSLLLFKLFITTLIPQILRVFTSGMESDLASAKTGCPHTPHHMRRQTLSSTQATPFMKTRRPPVWANSQCLKYFNYRLNLTWSDSSIYLYSESLRDWRSGDRIPVRARFSAPIYTGSSVSLSLYLYKTTSKIDNYVMNKYGEWR